MAAALLVAFGPAGCTPPRRPISTVDGAWQVALQAAGPVTVQPMPAPTDELTFPPDATVLVVSTGARVLESPFASAQRTALRQFVAAGGRLLLLGHAAHLAAAMGVEAEWPESTTFRWGFDGRTTLGSARLGVDVVSGKAPGLFDTLQAAPGREHTFLLSGGAPCSVPLCQWSIGAPKQGEVLARLAVELDGTFDGDLAAVRAPVVVRWRSGRGEVLAAGLVPDLEHVDPLVRDNARAFVRSCVSWLQRDHRGPVVLLQVPTVPVPAPVPVLPAFARHEGPLVRRLSHWGWQAQLRSRCGSAARTPDEVLHDVLLPSWLAGADLLELDLADAAHGAPLAWSPADPLQRPPSWRGAAEQGWSHRAFADLAGQAHVRGMLLAGAVDPLPVGERTTERLVALRFLARELADVRRLGAGAFDGLGVRAWWNDPQGYGASMLQDFHPGAFLYCGGELAGELAGGLRALDADDGVPRGANLAGISGVWRDGFPADQFPLGVLDARASRDARGPVDAVVGGGSHGDWIVTQANDFVRDRLGLGGAMWWRRHDPAVFDALSLAYVHGVAQEPLIAAVAMNLAATGRDGRRAAVASLLEPAPAGFGAESPVAAAVHVLQNNWFRLAGSGGALQFDQRGLGRFRPGEAGVLAPAFLRTRLFGGRPDGVLRGEATKDLLAGGRRGEGGHGHSVLVAGPDGADGAVGGDRRVPSVIAGDEQPTWPAAIVMDWRGEAGYHELELELRAVRGRGVVAVSQDGVVLRCAPFRAGDRSETVVVPLHMAGPGVRTLQIEVVEGGAVAIDRLRTVRRGEIGAAASVLVPAGSVASLEERTHSSLHAERAELLTIADFPGFVLRFTCEHAVRGLQVERTFQLPLHTQLAEASEAETAAGLRRPFVLRPGGSAAADGVPDVVVVPLQLARHDRLEFTADGLLLRGAPQAGTTTCVGMLFCSRTESRLLCQHATALLLSIVQPVSLDLGTLGEASLASDLPLPWSRLVHVAGAIDTPFLVRENGWWTWRGSQPAPDGGRWLRVRQEVGDTAQIVAGPLLFARTRPGPGAQSVVALRDPEALQVTVRIVQPSVLAAPSVVMGQDFDEVRLDGQPWNWFSGRTVFLPDRPGTYRIECRSHGGGTAPHVRTTRAPLVRSAYDADRRVLVLTAPPMPGRPIELPWTAVLGGPVPVRIENGEVVDESSLRHADAAAAAAARAGGVLIRFRSGITQVFYAE